MICACDKNAKWNHHVKITTDEGERLYSFDHIHKNDQYNIFFYTTNSNNKVIDNIDKNGKYLKPNIKKSKTEDDRFFPNIFNIDVFDENSKIRKNIFKKQAEGESKAWVSDNLNSFYFAVRTNIIYEMQVVDDYIQNSNTLTEYEIYKSKDFGKTIYQLSNWSKHDEISDIFFFQDATRGYILGSNRTIWKTLNGGESWHKIALPKDIHVLKEPEGVYNEKGLFTKANFPNDFFYESACFDKQTGKLVIVTFDHLSSNTTQGISKIYTLDWSEERFDYTQVKANFTLDNQLITHLVYHPKLGYVFISLVDDFSNNGYMSVPTYVSKIDLQSQLNQQLLGSKLYIRHLFLSDNLTLYTSGTNDPYSSYASYNEISFISNDLGGNWKKEKEMNENGMLLLQGFDKSKGRLWTNLDTQVYSRNID